VVTPWYKKPLYIGLISVGVILLLVFVFVLSMGRDPPKSSNSLNKLPA
jgi:hypothetical protein